MPKQDRRRIAGSHIYQRNGIWYAYDERDASRTSLRTRDREAATRLFVEHIGRELAERVGVTAPETALSDIVDAWDDAVGYERTTKRDYRNRAIALGAWLADQGVFYASQITPAVLDRWDQERAKTVARGTINRDLRPLRMCLLWAAERGLCSPCAAVTERKMIREPKRKPRRVCPDPAEMRRILDTLTPDALICARAELVTGTRISELRRLHAWSLRGNTLHIEPEHGAAKRAATTKGYRERAIPLSQEAADAVRTFFAWRAGGSGKNGRGARGCSNSWLLRQLHAACKATKQPKIGTHDLRRAFATEAHRAGVPLLVVSAWMGHADVSTTEGYLCRYRSDALVTAPLSASIAATEQAVQSCTMGPPNPVDSSPIAKPSTVRVLAKTRATTRT